VGYAVPRAAPLPVGETGVASGKGLRRDLKRNEIDAFGNFVCRFGWKALAAREGDALSEQGRVCGHTTRVRDWAVTPLCGTGRSLKPGLASRGHAHIVTNSSR
jgi:hypothetical protein